MEFVDTHCHIHEAGVAPEGGDPTRSMWQKAGKLKPEKIIEDALKASVTRLICIGTTLEDSQRAVTFVRDRPNCWASIGIHPHEAQNYVDSPKKLQKFCNLLEKGKGQGKIVALGECGLDYYYTHSPRAAQRQVLEFQLELASKHNLPVILHVRDAFSDFWPVFDQFKGLRGVVHSFSSTVGDLEQALSRGLYIGLNGIMTFTKNPEQLLAAKAIPLHNLLLETDAPFLTPAPYRGTICEPKHVCVTAEFLAGLRDENMATIAKITTQNACDLFGIGKL